MKDLQYLEKLMDAIQENDDFAVLLAQRLWEKQTDDEQAHEMTVYRNDVGYNSADAPWIGRTLRELYLGALSGHARRVAILQIQIRLIKYREQLSHLCSQEEIADALTVNKIS